jgi:hypothetical protein
LNLRRDYPRFPLQPDFAFYGEFIARHSIFYTFFMRRALQSDLVLSEWSRLFDFGQSKRGRLAQPVLVLLICGR